MDKDITRQITQLREEIAALDTGRDLARIGIKQTYAGALYAIWLAGRHGYLGMASPRSGLDEKRELAICDAVLRAVAKEEDTPTEDWVGEFSFGSALLRVAATIHGTLKHRYLPLFGEGFCRSQIRLEEQACRDGLITEADGRLLASIRETAVTYKHDHGRKDSPTVTSLNDLIVGLRIMVGVARGFPALPKAGTARG